MRGIAERTAGLALVTLMVLSAAACSGTAATPSANPADAATPTSARTPVVTPVPTTDPGPQTLAAPSADSRVLWTFAAGGSIYGTAAIADKAIYFGSDDGYLYSVDLATHNLRWKFKTGGIVRSEPAFDGQLVYFASDDGNVYAVKTADGSLGWKANIGTDKFARVLPDSANTVWDYHQASPLVSGERLFVGSADGNLYALNKETGDTIWTVKAEGPIRAKPAIANGTLYFGSWMTGLRWYSKLYAVDVKTGKVKWDYMGAGDHPTPVVVDSLVIAGGRQAYLYGLDVADGNVAWTVDFQTSWVESTPAYADGKLYVGSSALDWVMSIDAQTGVILWKFAPTGFPWSSPALSGGVVYVGSCGPDTGARDAGLWAIDSRTGKGLWWVSTSAATLDTSPAKLTGIAAGPIVVDGVIYTGALDGKLYAIQAN